MFRKIGFVCATLVVFSFSGVFVFNRIYHSPFSSEKMAGERVPASIQEVYDYSTLTGAAFLAAARERVFKSTRLSKVGDLLVINMGNFVLLNEGREKDFACGYFDKLSFVFEADGNYAQNERPVLTVETGCRLSSNINEMIPIKVPLEELRKAKPGDVEYKYFSDGQAINISVDHGASKWPETWVLKNIRLGHSRISNRLIQVPQQISMKW